MKLHDLRPADGAHRPKTRVGRGIAAGKGKTAGRGTKGQKARAGGSVPPWFEGGQTPLHMRIPKLRGFRNRFKTEYEVVNVGDIAARVDAGAFAAAGGAKGAAPKKGEPLTINADVLRAVGLVRDVRKPLKILGGGELSSALFVVADAFTKSATQKIEAAGGSVNVLEVPTESRQALGVEDSTASTTARTVAPGGTEADAAGTPAAKKPRRTSSAAATAQTHTSGADQAATATADASAPGDDAATGTDATPSDEPADAPDAVAEGAADTPVSGDESETDTAVPGDDA